MRRQSIADSRPLRQLQGRMLSVDVKDDIDESSQDGGHAIFRWTWTGTNTGPGGTGKSVRIRGHEEWTIGSDGLIAESKGHFDEAEYQRQLKSGAPSAV